MEGGEGCRCVGGVSGIGHHDITVRQMPEVPPPANQEVSVEGGDKGAARVWDIRGLFRESAKESKKASWIEFSAFFSASVVILSHCMSCRVGLKAGALPGAVSSAATAQR